MKFTDYGQKELSFVRPIVDEVISTYINSLRTKLSFTPKLDQLTIDLYKLTSCNSTGNCSSDSLEGTISMTLEINPFDSKKFIAFVIAHEFAHFLFLNPYDIYGLSGKSNDESTNFTAIQRLLPNGNTYGYYLEELLANYLAHFIVSKLIYEDGNNQYENVFESDKETLKIVHILETTFGKSICESDFIDQIKTSNTEQIEHNFFWDCIIAFSFNNIIDIYDDVMGKDEFHLLCNYIDEYCDRDFEKANNEFEKNMIWDNLISFNQKVREKDII